MSPEFERYWFPAKRHGWGWGAPRVWEGWAALLAFTGVVLAAAVLGQGERWTWPVIAAATLVLVAICLTKGEPARWRWGVDK